MPSFKDTNLNQLLIEGDKVSNEMYRLEKELDFKYKTAGFKKSDMASLFRLMALSIHLDEITKNIEAYINLQQLMNEIVHNPSN